ncbi:hypothetical protein RRG08_062508 [Elysia crispata]|uniref:Uncharacterized protein n=1 Tax=Elysia crispata TaxID=231223 RepID=A0AAE1DPV1_9GAST|nr:hypothetical protein RRG08_062508 [Elysia crispata]
MNGIKTKGIKINRNELKDTHSFRRYQDVITNEKRTDRLDLDSKSIQDLHGRCKTNKDCMGCAMTAATKHRSEASVILILCASLFIVTHCQNGPHHQDLYNNDPSKDTTEEIELADDGEQYQELSSQNSKQLGNLNGVGAKIHAVQQPSPHTAGQGSPVKPVHQETDRYSHHEQESHNNREAQTGESLQASHQFSSQTHEHSGSQGNQQQQQQAHKPAHDEQHYSKNHHAQQHLDQQRTTQQGQHEHFNIEADSLGEQHQQQRLHEDQQIQTHQQQQAPHSQHTNTQHQHPHTGSTFQQDPSTSQPPLEQDYPTKQFSHQDTPHDQIVLSGEVIHQKPPDEQMPAAEQVPLQEPPHEEFSQTERSPTQEPSNIHVLSTDQAQQHQEKHSFWPPNHPQHLKQEIPSTEEPSDKLDAGDQAIFPPILKEEDEDDFVDDFEEEEVEETPEPQLTPEEKKAEELFLAGEKLINATYYKEYNEAYLNFLEASKLNHQQAKEYVAFGYLFGDYLPQNVTKAAQLFEELASRGSPRAQMGLAFMYSAGFFYNSSQAKALIYSTFGALGGDPLAQMALGYRYYAGIGVESTCETALTYYRKVATKVADSVTLAGGPVVQRISLQDEAENVGTNNSPMLDDDLLQYYHFLADKGDQQAQVVLGTLYYQGGKGVQINHKQAYHYFSTAAESGSGHALGYLGKMHSEGSPFITQNNQTAFEFFKKSSEKNNHIGQAGLGMMYLNGLGVDKDVTKAFRYFSLASDQGSVDGQLQLGIMYFSGNGVRTDYKLAVKYFTMASQKGHVLAYYNLAQMHATGTGVLRNCHTAVELFKNVAERGKWSEMMMDAHRMYHEGNVDTALVKYMFLADLGYEVAQSNVAYLLDSGATLKFNMHESHQRALLQYSRAASQGSTLARLKMGDYYYYGLGTDVDYESAASHYRMASEQQNNAQAMFNLGYMHERGLGLKQDVHLAKRFYDMAAETSTDAHVPVTMALLKLGLFYGVDVFSKEFEGISGVLSLLDPMAYLGPQWDLFLASALAGFITLIYFLRRMR